MDRYAVINSEGKVVNIIIWDGISNWIPPEGHRVEKNHEVGIGDIWMPSINEFVRPLSKAKTPEDEEGIRQRQAEYESAKKFMKDAIAFVKPNNSIDL